MEQPYSESIAETKPGTIRLTLDDGSRHEVHRPVVSGDTIRDSKSMYSGTIGVYPVANVQSVEVTHVNTTPLVVGGVLVAVLVMLSAAACASGGCGP